MPTPHIADTRADALVHSDWRQRRIDHRVAQPREQPARGALDHTADQQQLHRRRQRAQQAAHGEYCEARKVGPPRPHPRQHGADGGRRHHRGDQVHRRDPDVEALPADIGDRARQQADGEELVGGVQRNAAGQHCRGAEVLRAQQVTPAAGGSRCGYGHAAHAKSSTAIEVKLFHESSIAGPPAVGCMLCCAPWPVP